MKVFDPETQIAARSASGSDRRCPGVVRFVDVSASSEKGELDQYLTRGGVI